MITYDEAQILFAHRDISDAPHGERAQVKQDWAARLKISVKTLDRKRLLFTGRQRKQRSDANVQRTGADREEIKKIMSIKKRLEAIEPDRKIAVEDAITIAERDGLIPAGGLDPRTVNRIAKTMGVNSETRTVRMDCATANKVHFTDGSGSEYFYPIERLADGDWLCGIRTSKEKEQKNRRIKASAGGVATSDAEPTRRMVYYYGILDYHSRLLYIVMIVAAGECSEDHAQALEMAWRPKTDCPMVGTPEILYTDNGPIGNSEMGRAMLDYIGVKLETHLPYNSKAKGAIERVWRTAWQRFELPFLIDRRRQYRLSELQAMLASYLVAYNAKKSQGYYADNRSRAQMYLEGMASQETRLIPEHVHLTDLLVRTQFRTVDASCRVQWDKKYYEIIGTPSSLVDRKELCSRTPFGEVEVRNPDTYIWMPTVAWKPVEFGEHRSFKHDINNELTAAGAALPASTRMLYEDAAAAAGNVVSLANAREIKMPEASAPGYGTIDEALLAVAELIGMPVWKLGEEVENVVREYLGDNLHDRAAITEFAEGMSRRVASAG